MNEENTDLNTIAALDDSQNEIPEKFKLDRHKIQTATLVDDNDELNQLGLSVFNQADLEQGFLLKSFIVYLTNLFFIHQQV